jgi:hypothetical protein
MTAREEAKRNEEIRRKSTRESHDARDAVAARETAKDAERKRREKKEEELVRKRIIEQIARDKEERARKNEIEKAARRGEALPQEPPAKVSATPAQAEVPKAYAETRLRLQAPSATIMKSFPVDTTLFEVVSAVSEELGFEISTFTTTFPKKTFGATEFGMTLKEAGMVPSAALIVK